MVMSRGVTTGSSRSSLDELPTRNTTNTQKFLETCVLDADHKALEEHLMSNPVQQSDLDRCLLIGLQIVQRTERALSHMAQALTILLQSGAKWNSDVLLDNQSTPYHIICQSRGDHHELLGFMVKSSHQTIINTQDYRGRTALMYAVCHANINCLKRLIANGAETNIGEDSSFKQVLSSALLHAMRILCDTGFEHLYVIMAESFGLLVDSVVDVDIPFVYCRSLPYFVSLYLTIPYIKSINKDLVSKRTVYCTKKLINKGSRLNVIDRDNRYVWSKIAMMGNIELLKYMFDHGIDKNVTNLNGLSILGHVIFSGNIEAVRYLLDLGVVIPIITPDVRKTQCKV